MTTFPVRYKLYDSAGTGLLYTFTYIQSDNSPQDPQDFVEITGLRGVGSVIIPGSVQPWDLNLRFFLQGVDYQDLIAKMDLLQTTIQMQTRYVLKIDRTSSTTKSYNVMRLVPISFTEDFRTDLQECQIIFRVNSWS